MEAKLSAQISQGGILSTSKIKQAQSIIGSCVHCGFCNAVCPTYQEVFNENDGPRGRIYQIKQMLEGAEVGKSTQTHIDNCLTCRSCETTCPSGVKYGELIDIGRELVEKTTQRAKWDQFKRYFLVKWLKSGLAFSMPLKLARFVRPLLPSVLQSLILVPSKLPKTNNQNLATQSVAIIVKGCVQDAILPSINEASSLLLHQLGYQVQLIDGCCSALEQHLGYVEKAQIVRKKTFDTLEKQITNSEQMELISMNSSGCSVSLKELPHQMNAQKTIDWQDKIEDFSIWFSQLNQKKMDKLKLNVDKMPKNIAYHPPCTLQHGQKALDCVSQIFMKLNIELMLPNDAHICCGSAGTYSILKPQMAKKLKTKKLTNLTALKPKVILSANIGCIQHLQSSSEIPIYHWAEFLAQYIRVD